MKLVDGGLIYLLYTLRELDNTDTPGLLFWSSDIWSQFTGSTDKIHYYAMPSSICPVWWFFGSDGPLPTFGTNVWISLDPLHPLQLRSPYWVLNNTTNDEKGWPWPSYWRSTILYLYLLPSLWIYLIIRDITWSPSCTVAGYCELCKTWGHWRYSPFICVF